MKKLVIFGTGGHAFSVFDSVYLNYEVVGFIDELNEGSFLGLPIYKTIYDVPKYNECFYHIGVGDCKLRKHFFDLCEEAHVMLANVIHPTAEVSRYAKIGKGNYIGRFAVIGVDVIIGDNNIINSKALVEHGCRIGSHNNISTNAILNGDDVIADSSFIGSNAVCKGQISVGNWSVVGCGAVCIEDVPNNVIVAGCPAKKIKDNC